MRLGEFLIGVEGLAVLRHAVTGDDAAVRARLADIARFSAGLDAPPLGAERQPLARALEEALPGEGRVERE